jgi:hypothetical protein
MAFSILHPQFSILNHFFSARQTNRTHGFCSFVGCGELANRMSDCAPKPMRFPLVTASYNLAVKKR